MLTSVSFLLIFLFGLNFKKRKNTVEAKFVPVIRWNLVPKVLSLTLSRLAPEPPVTVAVLCFYASPATASPWPWGDLGFGSGGVSLGARAPPSPPPRVSSLQPSQWPRALPSQPRPPCVLPFVPVGQPEREKEKESDLHVQTDFYDFYFIPRPPLLYALTAPRSSQNRASKL